MRAITNLHIITWTPPPPMAPEPLLKSVKASNSYRKILYHRFFVGLLLFIVVSLVFSVLFNVFSGSSPRTDYHAPVNLALGSAPTVRLKSGYHEASERLINCSYCDCFDVYRCGRGGHDRITIYIYPLNNYQTEEGAAISHFSREFYLILDIIRNSKYYTANPEEACLLVPSVDTLNQHTFSPKHVSRALQNLEL